MKACPSVLQALEELDALPDKTPRLRVIFSGNASVSSLGVKLPRLAAKDTPALSVPRSLVQPHDGGDKYLVVCLDLDAPFLSFSILGPILHWIQTDLVTAVEGEEDGFVRLETNVRSVMPYIGPSPPPGSAPHRYVFMLWEQPASVAGADAVSDALSLPVEPGLTARVRWDQAEFERNMGLGKPLAVNYFVANSE